MDTTTPTSRPPPLSPTGAARAPLALLALLLGLLALVLSPLLIGALPGVAGLIVALVHLRRNTQRRRLAWCGAGLSAAGLLVAVGMGCFYASLVLRYLPDRSGTSPAARAAAAAEAAADAVATHSEAGSLADQGASKALLLSAFCLDGDDNVLACDEEAKCVRVVTPDNTLKATWPLDFWPQAIACRADGRVVVAGAGSVVLLGTDGGVLARGSLLPADVAADAPAPARLRSDAAATAAAAMGDDVFVCTRVNTGYTVVRLNSRLEDPTPIIKGLRGCCGQLDLTARDGVLYVAANTDFKIASYDREGKRLGSFGRSGKGPEACFEGCCEPKNLAFGPDGSLYLAGSGKCAISRYTCAGGFVEYVGRVQGIAGCVRVTVAVNRDASRVYMLDTGRNVVRILARRALPPAAAGTPP